MKLTDMNLAIEKDSQKAVSEADKNYFDRLEEVCAKMSTKSKEMPLILLSGPSGSGKTTTALTLEKMLDSRGHETHVLSMDNYFHSLTLEQKRLKDEHKLDLESPTRLDTDFLCSQLESMIKGEPTPIYKFNFVTDTREKTGEVLTRKSGDLIILEGIHALNPSVFGDLQKYAEKVYVSVRTRIEDGDKVLHPKYIRLLRRMLRDKLTRNSAYLSTDKKFASVEEGEEKYIMPYKKYADFDIDTFFSYELPVYKYMLGEDLATLSELENASVTIPFLENCVGLSQDAVSDNSLIREFIGNGCFKY